MQHPPRKYSVLMNVAGTQVRCKKHGLQVLRSGLCNECVNEAEKNIGFHECSECGYAIYESYSECQCKYDAACEARRKLHKESEPHE